MDKVGKNLNKEANDLVGTLKAEKLSSVLSTNNITQKPNQLVQR